jgi:hypothetical protein
VFEDRGEIFLRRLRRQLAEKVVGAQCHHQKVGVRSFHAPVIPIEPVGRCVAGDTGIDELRRDVAIVEQLLKHGGQGGAGR